MKSFSNTARQFKQKGLTLIEMMIVIAIASVLFLVVAFGYTIWKKSQGTSEGRFVSLAMSCAMTSINAPNFSATTITTLVNKDCFGDGSNVVDKGTATGTANSKLSNAAYVVAAANLSGGTANGLSIATGPISKRSCGGMVEALDEASSEIIVTPTGGSASTVKPQGGRLDDDLLGLACNSANTVSILAAGSRS